MVVTDNIFDAIASSPEGAADLKLRSALFGLVRDEVKRLRLTRQQAAQRMSLSAEEFHLFRQGSLGDFAPGRLALMMSLWGRMVVVGVDNAAR